MKSATARRKKIALGWRYGWACAYCGEPIDPAPDHTGADPQRASLHHVTRLGAGGGNALLNLQLMHQKCQALLHAERKRSGADSAREGTNDRMAGNLDDRTEAEV